MRVLGKHCDLLQEFNITGSTRVNDEGILAFLGLDGEATEASLNPSARSLKFVKMRSTGVRMGGVRALMAHASSLEGVRCSNYDVLQVDLHMFDNFDIQRYFYSIFHVLRVCWNFDRIMKGKI